MEPNLVFIDGLPEDFDIKIIYDNLPITKEWDVKQFSQMTNDYTETIRGKKIQLKYLVCDFDKKTTVYLQFSQQLQKAKILSPSMGFVLQESQMISMQFRAQHYDGWGNPLDYYAKQPIKLSHVKKTIHSELEKYFKDKYFDSEEYIDETQMREG